jgi:endogenous inhibitor of DNA gyrase (YacG/DUF329 family)
MSKSEGSSGLAARRARKNGRRRGCPICGKPPAPEHRPFCSARCKQIDLGRWLGESYRIASEERREGEPGPADGEE